VPRPSAQWSHGPCSLPPLFVNVVLALFMQTASELLLSLSQQTWFPTHSYALFHHCECGAGAVHADHK
jgi:hypothetical protein